MGKSHYALEIHFHSKQAHIITNLTKSYLKLEHMLSIFVMNSRIHNHISFQKIFTNNAHHKQYICYPNQMRLLAKHIAIVFKHILLQHKIPFACACTLFVYIFFACTWSSLLYGRCQKICTKVLNSWLCIPQCLFDINVLCQPSHFMQ